MIRRFLGGIFCLGLALGWALLQPSGAAPPPAQASSHALPFIGLEYPVSDFNSPIPASGEHPASAFNPESNQFLVVWESLGPTIRKIAVKRIAEGGRPTGEAVIISTGSLERLRPAVAYNSVNREYLVVWMLDARGDGSRYEIWGQRLTWDGRLVDPAFLISSDRLLSLWSPRLVWAEASNQYLVVWEARDSSEEPVHIGMKLLLANGDFVAGMTLSASNVQPESPDVVYNPLDTEYLVVWTQQNSDNTYSLTGTRRDLYGNRVDSGPFSIYTSNKYLINSRAAFNEGLNYAVIFELAFNSYDHDIYLSVFDRYAGSFQSPKAIAQTWREERFPQISSQLNQADFMIIYRYDLSNESQIWLHPYPDPGSQDAKSEELLCDRAGWIFNQPVLTAGASGSMAVYAGGLPEADPHIYAREFWPLMTFLPVIQSR